MDDLEIDVQSLRAELDQGRSLVLVDVRTPMEVELASLPGATVIPLQEFVARHRELSPDDEIVCFCHHGMRSFQAAMFLKQQGYARVRSLAGGLDAWSRLVDPSIPRY